MASRADYVTHEEATTLASAFFNTPNLRVVDFHAEPFAAEKLGYLADHKLLTVKVHRDGEHEPENCTFFLKTTMPNCNDFEALIFEEEKQFFNDALPRLLDDFEGEPWAPKCYLVKDNLLVLEDLRAREFQIVRGKFTVDQLRTAIATVARFHACSMLLQAKSGGNAFAGRFKEKVFVNDDYGLAWKWLATGIEVGESVARDLGLDPKHLSVAYDMMLERVKPAASSEDNVLSHEDLWCSNMMFSEDERNCRLVDFQMAAYTCFAIDVLQLIYLNADWDTRRRSERELVQHYHSVLERTLVEHGFESDKVLSLDRVFKTIEEKRVCGLVMAVQYFPISLLNAQLAKEFSQDYALYQHYVYTSRKDFVNRAMQLDEHYRRRVQESVRELVEFMEHFRCT